MDEVSGPVVAIGLVLCAVFVPVSFMGGIYRPVVPAVRHHDLHFRDPVGHRGLDAHARAVPA